MTEGFAHIGSCELPTDYGRIACDSFSLEQDGQTTEALAMKVGEVRQQSDILLRVHSQCLTSEVFGSLKCDCKQQLDYAMELIRQESRGLLIYTLEEGRGIGLANKIAAYGLQDKGLNTIEANEHLGHDAELRRYALEPAIAHHYGIRSVRMITNNPEKLAAFRDAGIPVNAVIHTPVSVNDDNRSYLTTKAMLMGHNIPLANAAGLTTDEGIKKAHIADTREILQQSQQEHPAPYTAIIHGQPYTVLPGVFPSGYFEDTEFFQEVLSNVASSRFLEVGPGIGALAVQQAKQGAEVVAIDISEAAVKNTRVNADAHGVSDKVTVHQGDVYTPSSQESFQKVDTIFWNVPFGYVEEDLPLIERTVFDPEYRCIRRCIQEAPQHLTDRGQLLLGFSNTMGRRDLIDGFAAEVGATVQEVASTINQQRKQDIDFCVLAISFPPRT